MSLEESLEERQLNEFEALKSIFNEDIIDYRDDTSFPLNLVLKLRPLQNSSGTTEVFAKINLHVTCSKNYPNEIPRISLENSQGISNAKVTELLQELLGLCNKHMGEEIIYLLAQHVQEFLHKHNTRPEGSFYEQMLSQQKLREESQQHTNKIQEDQKRQVLHDEILKRKEILKTEERFRKDSYLLHENKGSDKVSSTESSSELLEIPTVSKCKLHNFSKEIEFSNNRKVVRGCCIDHSEINIISYIAIDLCTGEPLYLKEYTIHCTLTSERRYRNNQLSSGNSINHVNDLLVNIEQQLNRLIDLRHSNLVPYEDYTCFIEKNSITIYLLQPFLLFSKSNHIGARNLANASLKALAYLHRNNVSHSNFVHNSIIVDQEDNVRLRDFGFQLVMGTSDISIDFQKDFHSLGEILKKEAHVENDPDLWDFIKICQTADRHTSADMLLQHQYLCLDNISSMYGQSPRHNREIQNQEDKISVDCFPISNKSRILSEFTEIVKIGKGAFGDVIKVRNNLDGCEYAIKKIPLNPRNRQLYGKITREVKLLSKLYHENVVRYYNSWIETAKIENLSNSKTDELSVTDEKSWSVSYEARKSQKTSSGIDDESDSESDDFIQFKHNSNSESDNSEYSDDSNNKEQKLNLNNFRREFQYMYIQMEFCEKSTLRTAIDDGLASNSDRCWRLFHEILEGLAHIHQQGMIHRDLKPVNIFIDSRDHVKIGDFGLATTSVMVRSNETNSKTAKDNFSNTDASLTSHVGTALYVAPELIHCGQKVQYNEKVDIYSLGIILFEMIYPFDSMMERAKVLQNLRLPEIKLTNDIIVKCRKHIPLIKWLLNHDAANRPSSAELLVSDMVPPVRLEDRDLFEMIRITLDNPKGKPYKHLIAKCLEQKIDDALDLTYHVDLSSKNQTAYSYIKEVIIQVFRKHGALDFSTPLLTPASVGNDFHDSVVRLMTHSGCVVTLPSDLRTPFARHAAMSDMRCMRRFSVSHVYSERRVFGFHPRQNLECVMDILVPVSSKQDSGDLLLLLDAEMMSIASEVASCFPMLQQSQRTLKLQLNHSGLLQAALAYCSVPRDKKKQLFTLLDEYRNNKINKFPVQMFLNSLGTGSTNLSLLDLLDSETIIGSDCRAIYNTVLGMLLKARGDAGKWAKEAISQIETVAKLAVFLGVQCPMYICPCLRVGSGDGGISWRLVCEGGKQRGNQRNDSLTVLAMGTRYDEILHSMRQHYCQLGADDAVRALGITISPERILQAIISHNLVTPFKEPDALVAVSDPYLLKDVAQVLRRLWSSGLRASPLLNPVGTSRDEAFVEHRCVITPCGGGDARIKIYDNERFQEKKIPLSDVCDYLLRSIVPEGSNDMNSTNTVSTNMNQGGPQLNIQIIINEKMHANQRRRYEHQAKCHMSEALSRLNSHCKLQILCVNLQSNVMSALADKVYDVREEKALDQAISETIDLYPKSKKYLIEIGEKISTILSEVKPPIIAFYSLASFSYRILL